MVILENIKNWAWIFILVVSVFVAVLTFLKIKEKKGIRIRFAMMRGIIFFGIMYLPLIDQPRLSAGIALPIIAVMLLVFGLYLIVRGARELTKTQLQGITGVPDRIITTGLYAVIRHPINLGFMFAFLGWYLLWAGTYSLIFPPVLVVILIFETFWEERKIEKTLGEEYTEYKKRVGMFTPKLRER